MKNPDFDSALDDLVLRRFNRLTAVVNDDLLNLRIAMYALGARFVASGPTDEEIEKNWVPALEWVRDVGVDRASEHMVVGLWAAVEVYVEDVFVLFCSHRDVDPDCLPNVRIRVAEFMVLAEDERWRAIWNRAETGGKPAVDHYDDVFGRLGISIDTGSTKVEGAEHLHMDNARTRKTLRELQAVRNIIVHLDGRVDRRLADLDHTRYELGHRVELSDEAMLDFGNAIHNFAAALGSAAGGLAVS